jgi:ribonuclease J
LSEEGFMLPIITLDKLSGEPGGLPEIVSRGFISEDGSELLQEAQKVVARTINTATEDERADRSMLKEKIRIDLRRFLIKQTSRHPLIMPVIIDV